MNPMFNIHIGLPGLYADILYKHTPSSTDLEASSSKLLAHDDYEGIFRELVNRRGKASVLEADQVYQAHRFVQELAQYRNVAISQPGVFGVQAQVFNPSRVLPFAERRIRRLSDMFDEYALSFHLVITNPIDYIWSRGRLSRAQKEEIILRKNISWADFVKRISNAVPNRQIFVWDFERPQEVAPLFIADLLGTPLRTISGSMTDSDAGIAALQSADILDEANAALTAATEYLDNQYESDLAEIDRLEGITLVRSDGLNLD